MRFALLCAAAAELNCRALSASPEVYAWLSSGAPAASPRADTATAAGVATALNSSSSSCQPCCTRKFSALLPAAAETASGWRGIIVCPVAAGPSMAVQDSGHHRHPAAAGDRFSDNPRGRNRSLLPLCPLPRGNDRHHSSPLLPISSRHFGGEVDVAPPHSGRSASRALHDKVVSRNLKLLPHKSSTDVASEIVQVRSGGSCMHLQQSCCDDASLGWHDEDYQKRL